MSQPSLDNFEQTKNKLKFTLTGIDTSIANGLRRVIISNIPTFAFKTFPHNESNVVIHKNNTRLNNEILKQRISCIPIHIKDHSIDPGNYEFIINITNDTEHVINVTTGDFQVKNVATNKFLPKEEVVKIFPPNKITGDFIVIGRLRPKMGDSIKGETLHFTGKMSLETAQTDGAFNVSHTCFYRNSVDPVKQNKEWSIYEKQLTSMNPKEKEMEKKNWYLHQGLRHFKQNSFDFTIESVGVFKNKELLDKACDIFVEKVQANHKNLQDNKSLISKSNTTLENSFDIVLENEDYTIGKVIEFLFHENYYKNKNLLSYVGFRKHHPHDSDSVIRIAFHKETEQGVIYDMLHEATQQAVQIYKNIKELF